MLVVFPIGLWVFSLVGDIVYLAGGPAAWLAASYYAIGVGIVGALLAAIPGMIDLVSMRPGQAKRVGIWHMGLNLAAVVVFAITFYLRTIAVPLDWTPFVISLVGVGIIGVSGWLGGEMVYVHGMAVDQAAPSTRLPRSGQHREAA